MDESASYDKGGNISQLVRNGQSIGYQYFVGKNQLQSVIGNGLQAQSYQYDLNGNSVVDGSKNNVNIEYNYLDLPKAITGAQTVNYEYDASGKMLRKSGPSGLMEYVYGIQYSSVNSSYGIEFIKTGYGRAVRLSDGSFRYQYDLTDHLGNVRLTFDKDPTSGTARRIQEDNYFAFGKRVSVVPVSTNNRYLYNGKDIQDELGEYDYGARFYNPEIGRWNVQDPLAEQYQSTSPYAYVLNNPIYYTDPDGMASMDWYLPIGQSDKSKAVYFPGSAYREGYINIGHTGTGVDDLTGAAISFNYDGSKTYGAFGLPEVEAIGKAPSLHHN